jgi:MFS family permease
MNQSNASRLFHASCIALIATAMTFAIRAGMMDSWKSEFGLNNEQVGHINSMAFYGFPLATILGGLILDSIGMGTMLTIAFLCHLSGLLLTIFSGGFWGLLVSTFLVGFANGSVEAACNPMVASLYPNQKTTMLNRFHVWFPGGIVLGAVLGFVMASYFDLGWRLQCAIILVPTVWYGYLFYRQSFPQTERVTAGVSNAEMLSAVFANPLFWFITGCMFLTATTELGTGQWIASLLQSGDWQVLCRPCSSPAESDGYVVDVGGLLRLRALCIESGIRVRHLGCCGGVCCGGVLFLAYDAGFCI